MQDNQRIEIYIDPDAQSLQDRFDEMLRAYEEMARGIKEAFRQADLTGTVKSLVSLNYYTEKFSGQLSYLRLSLGRLKAAFTQAFAPIGAYVLPLINRAINHLASFLHAVGAVFAAVTDSVRGTDSAALSAENAAKSYKNLGAAAKKSLAGFDRIERLNGGSGSAAASTYNPLTAVTYPLKEWVSKILNFLEPLRKIDFSHLQAAFQKLWQTVQPLLAKLGEALNWLWQAVAAPFIAWCMEVLFPALTDTFSGALDTVGSSAGSLITGIGMLFEALRPVGEFIRSAIVTALQSWQQIFGALAGQLSEKGPEICTIFHNVAQVVTKIWNVIGPILTALYTQFQTTFAGIGAVAAQIIGAILEGLAGLSEFVAGVFTGDWKRAWNGILYAFKGLINSLIGLLNALLTKLTGALNGVIRLANAMSFTVPSWVPGIGGKKFGFGMKTVTAPQIPYLARGAVLPANRPFLAMVGDQRHGTNIEAPLTTIQEAMGAVMGDYAAGNMAGHEATVAVLKQILEAVLGMELSDSLIAAAAGRYGAKMAIVRGGA